MVSKRFFFSCSVVKWVKVENKPLGRIVISFSDKNNFCNDINSENAVGAISEKINKYN